MKTLIVLSILAAHATTSVPLGTMIEVAKCESQLGKYRTNWEGSSAEGLFMFMPKTFNAYCSGNIKNDVDQTRCFVKLYPKHPNWWKCKPTRQLVSIQKKM